MSVGGRELVVLREKNVFTCYSSHHFLIFACSPPSRDPRSVQMVKIILFSEVSSFRQSGVTSHVNKPSTRHTLVRRGRRTLLLLLNFYCDLVLYVTFFSFRFRYRGFSFLGLMCSLAVSSWPASLLDVVCSLCDIRLSLFLVWCILYIAVVSFLPGFLSRLHAPPPFPLACGEKRRVKGWEDSWEGR